MSDMQKLLNTLPQRGRVQWIGLRSEKRKDLNVVDFVDVNEDEGLIGDRYRASSRKRQVTLIQEEHLIAVGAMLGIDKVHPNSVRRNIVVSGINLLALKDKQFQVGTAVLEMTGLCHPCSRMEENLGPGGYNAMRGHGGITAKVIRPGKINLGDELKVYSQTKD